MLFLYQLDQKGISNIGPYFLWNSILQMFDHYGIDFRITDFITGWYPSTIHSVKMLNLYWSKSVLISKTVQAYTRYFSAYLSKIRLGEWTWMNRFSWSYSNFPLKMQLSWTDCMRNELDSLDTTTFQLTPAVWKWLVLWPHLYLNCVILLKVFIAHKIIHLSEKRKHFFLTKIQF